MDRSLFVRRLHRLLGALTRGESHTRRPDRGHRATGLEYLEGRAVPATINASGVINSVAASGGFTYTIDLTNSSSSNSGIGTFWYGWVPGEDFLATSPTSVVAPTGWTGTITHGGASDGYAIEFVSQSSIYNVAPGSSTVFSFNSTSPPSAVNGNSVFYPSTPVNTAFVYPGAPFSDAGHQFVLSSTATPTPTPAPTPTPTASPTPTPTPTGTSTPTPAAAPLVGVVSVQAVKNRNNVVTAIDVRFSGPLDAVQANNTSNYRLVAANRKGLFTARNSVALGLRSAILNPANDTVTLTLKKTFALSSPVQLTINGTAPSGLQDSSGRLIDGNGDGASSGNAIAVISRSGVSLG
jgi:hypothetical protein